MVSNRQRIEQLEQGMVELRASISQEVQSAMNSALLAFQETLSSQITESLEKATQKMGEEFVSLSDRLEGRVTRARADHESVIATCRRQQERFQAEVRVALGSRLPEEEQNHPESSRAGERRGRGSVNNGGPDQGEELERRFDDEEGAGFGGGYRGGGWRAKKLDLPLFNGSNPDGWIIRAERFFSFYRLSEVERVEAAVVSLEGDALLWY